MSITRAYTCINPSTAHRCCLGFGGTATKAFLNGLTLAHVYTTQEGGAVHTWETPLPFIRDAGVPKFPKLPILRSTLNCI